MLFLHEAATSDATDEALIDALQSFVDSGKVRALGIASDFERLPFPLSLPSNYQVIQLNNDVAARNIPKLANGERRALIVHSVFKPLASLRISALAQPDVVNQFSSRVQADLSDPTVLGNLLLQYALAGEAGLVLFSSTSLARVSENAKSASTTKWNRELLTAFATFVDTLLKKEPDFSPNPRTKQ
jgi:aryl-alcohol dehydrogenase-like predicted oxidoreductase